MTHTKTTPFTLECGPVAIRALNSLSRRHVEAISAVTCNGWTIQTIDDYEGHLSMVVEPSEPTSNKPSYLISGTIQEIELEEFHDEELTAILKAADITGITNELSRRLQG